jgi:hypothetical protein
MKLKTAALVTGVAVAAGVAGLGVGASARASVAERASASREDAPDARVETLLLEVEAAREREAALRRELDATRAPEPPAAASEPVSRLQEEARRLAVPDDAMAAALRAEEALAQNRDDAWDLVRELQRFGDGGFRAALALVRGGTGPWEPQWKLIEETYKPGLEGLLLDTLDAEVGWNAKAAALHALAKADTPAVRESLVARLEREKDRAAFAALATTLGKLREPRAAKAVGKKLLFDDPIEDAHWRPARLGLLHRLSEMGGEDAVRSLRDFVADPRVTDGAELVQALGSLYLLDVPLCGEAARRLLEEPRGAAVGPPKADTLRNFAAAR